MKGKRFGSFNNEFQLLANTLPMLVSVTKNPDDETEEQFITTHDHFMALDEITKDKLAAQETANKIQFIGKSYNLNLVQMSDIARAVRSYYFGEIKQEDFPHVFAQEMGIDLNKSQEISSLVIQKIINDNLQEQAYQAQLAKISLSEALKKYPELGEQLITSSHIKLQNFPDPARPSIKNWLFDYTFNMGHEAHNSMVRGSFLFQNENAKRLASPDRQKLAFVLKAYDENAAVTINLTTKQIVFPKTNIPSAHELNQPAPPNAPRQNNLYENRQHINQTPNRQNPNIPSAKLNFSSPQKMPFENQPRGPQPIRISPPGMRRDFGGESDNLNRNIKPLPKNVVNLKE